MFVDEVDINVSAGHGGRGAISFRREKFIPRGGPDGGDGGAGGSVYLLASPHHNTLVSYRFHPDFAANRGGNGEGSLRTGKSAKDIELPVPPGTVAYRIDEFGHAHQFADLVDDRRPRPRRQGRTRRPRQCPLHLVDQPRAAARRYR